MDGRVGGHLPSPLPDPSRCLRIVLGGRFGEEPFSVSARRLDHFWHSGGRLVDTAHSYADGVSERVIGRWMRQRRCRDDVTIIDKVCHPDALGRPRGRPETIREELDGSLARLGTTWVDLLMLHRDDPTVPVTAVVEALAREVRRGRVRAFGVSNWPAPRLAEFLPAAADAGHRPTVSYQFSLAVPRGEIWPGAMHATPDLRRLAQSAGVPLLAWSAQARGWFTRGTGAAEADDPFDTPTNRLLRRRCRAISAERGSNPATVALAWTLHQQPATWPIVGPANLAEQRASLAAAGLTLSPDEMRFLDQDRQT